MYIPEYSFKHLMLVIPPVIVCEICSKHGLCFVVPEFLQPYKPRPQTVASVARNMVAGALGIRSQIPREKREEERQKLREAKGKNSHSGAK